MGYGAHRDRKCYATTRGELGETSTHQLKTLITETIVKELQALVSQKSGVDDSLDLSTGLLTPESTPEPSESMPETVIAGGETAGNSTYKLPLIMTAILLLLIQARLVVRQVTWDFISTRALLRRLNRITTGLSMG